MLPNIAPTGKRVEILLAVIVYKKIIDEYAWFATQTSKGILYQSTLHQQRSVALLPQGNK
jgi:hypothetical protein